MSNGTMKKKKINVPVGCPEILLESGSEDMSPTPVQKESATKHRLI